LATTEDIFDFKYFRSFLEVIITNKKLSKYFVNRVKKDELLYKLEKDEYIASLEKKLAKKLILKRRIIDAKDCIRDRGR